MVDLGSVSRLPHEATTGAHTLADGTGVVSKYQFYFASKKFIGHEAKARRCRARRTREVDEWAKNDIGAVAEQLSPSVGLPVPVLEVALKRQSYGIKPINDGSSQSATACRHVLRLGLMPESHHAYLTSQGNQDHDHAPEFRPQQSANILWFLPTHGDGHYLGTTTGGRDVNFHYLRQIAQAADQLGYFGVLLPTGRSCEDSWVVASAVAPWTERLRYLVAVRPGLQSPSVAARMTATLDRVTNGRLLINVVTGGDPVENKGDGIFLDHNERYAVTREFLNVYSDMLAGKTVNVEGKHIRIEDGRLLFKPVQSPRPPLYFGGSSDAGIDVAVDTVDKYLTWGEPPAQVAEKVERVRAAAAARGRKLSFGIRLHVIVRETNEEAWKAADDLIKHVTDDTIASAQKIFSRMDSVGQQRMLQLHGGRRDKLEISPNLWAGVGLVRGGAGTALVGDAETVAARIKEYQDIGIDTFIMSGYPHLEEAYRFAELVFPLLSLNRRRQCDAAARQYRAVRRDHRQRTSPADQGLAIMSLIESLPRVRSLQLPRPDGLIQWIVPLAIMLIWQLACVTGFVSARVLPAPSDVAVAGWKLLLSGELEQNIWVSFWRAGVGFVIGGGIGFAFGLANGLSQLSSKLTDTTLQMVRNIPHLALIPLVILWFGIDEIRKAVFGRARRVLSDLPQHAARHPHRRSAIDRDGAHLRHERSRAVPPRDLSGRAAVDLRRHPLRARHHVADVDRGGNHRGVVRPRLHGDAGARIHADRCRRAQHPDLRLAGKVADSASRALERLTLSWHPAFAEIIARIMRTQMQQALRFHSDPEALDRSDPIIRISSPRRGLGTTGPDNPQRGLPLTIRGLRKSFGSNEVLRGIDLHIPAGQFVAIVGRSGCGKSTLLRMIAGLERIDGGSIGFGGETRPEDIRVMFQEPRLLPWARVLSNVEVGLGRDRAIARCANPRRQGVGRNRARRQARSVAGDTLRRTEAARGAGAGAGQPSAPAGVRRAARRARRADADFDAAAIGAGMARSGVYRDPRHA